MASERELNLLIRARDEASRVVEQNQRSFRDLERSIEDVGRAADSSLERIPDQLRSSQSEIRRTQSEFQQIERTIVENERSVRELNRSMGDFGSSSGQAIGEVQDHLQDVSVEIRRTRQEFETLRDTRWTVEELNDALDATRVSAGRITSVSAAGREASAQIRLLTEATNRARMAARGLSVDGRIRISTDEAVSAMEAYNTAVQSTMASMATFRSQGQFGAYQGGMNALQQSIRQVQDALDDAGGSGSSFFSTMQQMGVYTSNSADAQAVAMEAYRDRFISSIDMMIARSTQGEQIQQNFERMGRPLQGLTGMLNGVSSDLERMARAGRPAALALQELGPNASMADLQRHIRLINQGIMRMQAVTMVAGIALLGFTAIMAKAASGPNPADVLKKQEEALKAYHDALKKRTDEIYNTWKLFQDVQIKHTSPAKLMANLQEQVTIMQQWSGNLQSLVKKGVDEGLIAELRKMGPAAAGEIAALNKMSGPELDKYVDLWKQKHSLARVAATTELAQMKEDTKKKIQELQDTLKPLGISFEEFKKVWATALKPFVEVWGIIAAKVVDFGTAIGNLIIKLNEINPEITALAGMFMYLFTAITLLLAPLAVGISRAGGMAAAFSALWAVIGPFVTGFLAIAGYAAVLAAALVALGYSAYKLWENSEILRESLIGGWERIKATVLGALSPLIGKFSELALSFGQMLSGFTGGAGTMANVWKTLGDKIGAAINWIVSAILPILSAAIGILVQVISLAIDGLIFVFGKITEWWSKNSDTINGYLSKAKDYFLLAFNAIKDFIISIMPAISQTVTMAVDLIKAAFEFAMPIITTVVKVAFGILKTVMTVLWPIIVSVIQGAWENIKAVVTSGIAIIQNVIQLFTNILKGNWSEAWENVKNILSNAVTLLWNLIQLWFIGKILGVIKNFVLLVVSQIAAFWTTIHTAFTVALTAIAAFVANSWTSIKNAFTTAITAIKTAVQAGWTTMSNVVKNTMTVMQTTIQAVWTAIKAAAQAFVNSVKTTVSNGFTAMKNVVINVWNALKSGMASIIQGIVKIVFDLKDDIVNTFKNINLVEIGKNIIQGLINGIGSLSGMLMDKVKGIADGIKDAITGALKIKSPSRWAIGAGGYFSEGLAIGIKKAADLATNAASDLAQGVMQPVQGGLSAGAAYGVGAQAGGGASAAPVYVTFHEGAFAGAFPGVSSGEEVTKAISSISLKAAFKSQ